jgi:hypothetical protein
MNDQVKPGDSDTPPEGAEKNTDKNDLNSLLASWEDKPKDSKEDPKPKGEESGLAAEVARLTYEREMDKLIPIVKGDLKVSDKFVEAFMNMRANEDQRLRSLWDNRHERRPEFEQAMTALGEDLKKEIGAPVKETPPGGDDKGLAAAFHAAKESQAAGGGLDDLDFSTMSDTDFGFKKAEIFRLAEQGKLKPD